MNVPKILEYRSFDFYDTDSYIELCHNLAYEKLEEKYPQYKFSQHKGYGTKLHYEMIAEHGICPEHRRTFLKKILG